MKILQACPPHLSDVATLPWEIQKSHFQQYYSCILLIRPIYMLSQKKTNCNPLAHPTWKCHHTNLWIANFLNLTEGLLRSFKRSRLWKELVVGCRWWLWKNRLWYVATGISGKQCHSKSSEWPPLALIHASSLFSTLFGHIVHHAVLKFSPCRNKPLPQNSACPYQYTRSSCSVPQTQY